MSSSVVRFIELHAGKVLAAKLAEQAEPRVQVNGVQVAVAGLQTVQTISTTRTIVQHLSPTLLSDDHTNISIMYMVMPSVLTLPMQDKKRLCFQSGQLWTIVLKKHKSIFPIYIIPRHFSGTSVEKWYINVHWIKSLGPSVAFMHQ